MSNGLEFGSQLAPPGPRTKKSRRAGKIIALIAVLGLILTVTAFFGLITYKDHNKRYYIPSGAMQPTLQVNDVVKTRKLDSDEPLQRGWIVTFNPPPREPDSSVKTLIKRVVALPGETVEARNGVVYVNDQALVEPYLENDNITSDLPRTVVPEGQYFVLGDNRTDSLDSRYFGPIDRGLVKRQAVAIVSPGSHKKSLR